MEQDSLVAGAGTLGGRGEGEGRKEKGGEWPGSVNSEQMREGRLPKSDSLQIFILVVLQLKCKKLVIQTTVCLYTDHI